MGIKQYNNNNDNWSSSSSTSSFLFVVVGFYFSIFNLENKWFETLFSYSQLNGNKYKVTLIRYIEINGKWIVKS